MAQNDWVASYLRASHGRILFVATLAVAGIAAVDAWIFTDVSVGFLYIIPILAVSFFLNRWQIAALAVFCAGLRSTFTRGFPGEPEAIRAILADAEFPRTLLVLATFLVSGFFVSEFARNRRLVASHLQELEQASEMRRRAEEELGVLVNTSPAAIFITDGEGRIIQANASAHQLLDFDAGTLAGVNLADSLPALATVPAPGLGQRPLQSNLECRGRRRDGSSFLAQVWLSTYRGAQGPRMAAIVLDASENLRDREGGGLRSLMVTSRILMGAVSHSVRNLCAAARVAYTNLQRKTELTESEDFQALGTLIRGLGSISSTELSRTADRTSTVDLNTLFDELRVVIEPGLQENNIQLEWLAPNELPLVLGEHFGLLHALLNIVQNATHALSQCGENRTLRITAAVRQLRVSIGISDNAGGVDAPEHLFEPFYSGTGGTGLGTYLARALVRSFEGDLRYEPVPGGSTFTMELVIAADLQQHATGRTS